MKYGQLVRINDNEKQNQTNGNASHINTLILLSFYGGWQIRGLGILENLPCALGRDKADDNMSDEKPTFNTIDSILLQAMSYCKANGSYPELNLIEIPIGATINRGRIADQYGRDIRYGVTSAVLEVRSAGKDGLFGTGDDIVGIIPSDKVGRRITSKNETFSLMRLTCERLLSSCLASR